MPIPSLLACSTVHHALTLRGHAPAGRAGRRVRRAARDPSPRGADRLRRDRDQPVPDARDDDDARRAHRRPRRAARRRERDRDRRHQQGPAQGPLEDRDRDDPLLPRRADLRDRRHRPRRSSTSTSPAPPRASTGSALGEIAREALDRHARAYPEAHGMALPEHVEDARLAADSEKLLPQGGVYRWRRDGEKHMWDPETIASLQRAARDRGRRRPRVLRGVQPSRQRRERRARAAPRPVRVRRVRTSRSRSTRSSRRPRSSSASRPER